MSTTGHSSGADDTTTTTTTTRQGNDYESSAEAPGSPSIPMLLVTLMNCEICNKRFDIMNHKPRNLQCGHSFCTVCCKALVVLQEITCPKCRQNTMSKKSAEDLPVNYLILDLTNIQPSEYTASPHAKQLISQRIETSLHGGRCLEAQAKIIMYCAYCKVWLCEDCSCVDHQFPPCLLRSSKDILEEKHQALDLLIASTHKTLKSFDVEMKMYSNELKSVAGLMEVFLNFVNTDEQARLGQIRDHYKRMDEGLRYVGKRNLSDSVEEALLFNNTMEDLTTDVQKWTEGATAFLKMKEILKLSKVLLLTTVQLLKSHALLTHEGKMLAFHTIDNVSLGFPLEVEGGRILIHAPTSDTHSKFEKTFLKLENIKPCIDPSCALTFLDISLREQEIGRIFIRLLGNTKMSRAFLTMCTGETGTSYRNTPFHRVWWEGLPGEHVWAGDYDQRDGSGGTLPTRIRKELEYLPEKTAKESIRVGLVAGKYWGSTSTLFRVYTKTSDDGLEEYAIGCVEEGFHNLKLALEMHKEITDVTISGCGVVVECESL